LKFIYHCFLRPFEPAKGDQKLRLEQVSFIFMKLDVFFSVYQFYDGQADVYDVTRGGLLRGRDTMLALAASHLRVLRDSGANKRLVWVDIGGGTG
jgi:betaine lipid synthase